MTRPRGGTEPRPFLLSEALLSRQRGRRRVWVLVPEEVRASLPRQLSAVLI